MFIGFIYNISFGIESEDIISNATRTTGLRFVFVPEKFKTSCTTAVIKWTVSENSKQGTFTSVYISSNSDSGKIN